MSYQIEAELEAHSIELLKSLGWNFVTIRDQNDLINNFRNQINLFNNLDVPLTDKEFSNLYSMITGYGVYDSSKILREQHPIEREDGSILLVKLFDSKDWCGNLFQVTHQTTVKGKSTNRYDINLLVNGIPLGQLELKRSGGSFREAFNQIERYRRDSFQGLYNFQEIFMFSDKQNTKYFANNDGEILYSQTFHWTDENNEKINLLEDFIESFLTPCHFAKMVARFTVVRESEKKLIVMRPYQVYAVEKVVDRALNSGENGYIWHTTGSGKTLTAFKIGEILSLDNKFFNTIILVDRKDLDQQTIDEFNAFSRESIDATLNTKSLIRDLNNKNKNLIVTTIQKLNYALKNSPEALASLFDKPVAFIIDECHRSQLGEMHKLIKKSFTKGQYFGFTGTPIFPENKPQGQTFTTADLFNKCLHTYLLKDGITDGNVLGFEVKYYDTVKQVKPIDNDELVENILTDEILHSEVRLENIAKNIVKQHHQNTMERQYSALFATDGIETLIRYYDIFKKIQEGSENPIKIAAIYFYQANEDMAGKEESARDAQSRMMADYNNMFGTSFSSESFEEYFKDVSRRLKTGEIDILLVVDMLLTGFDSRYLNTLYVDKNMRHHGLIQAFSRTNRVELPRKKYGLIRCYRPLKNNVDEAIKMFSKQDSIDFAIAEPYGVHLAKLIDEIFKLRALVPDSIYVDKLQGETAQAEFVQRFRSVATLINTMRPYVEFEFDAGHFGLTEQEFMDYRSKYLNLSEKSKKTADGASVLSSLDFAIEEVFSDTINVDYILRLISNINLSNSNDVKTSIKSIIEQIKSSDSKELLLKSEHLIRFLKHIETLPSTANIDVEFNSFKTNAVNDDIKVFVQNLFPDDVNNRIAMLEEWLSEYEFSGTINESDIMKSIKLGLIEKQSIKNQIIDFIKGIEGKY